MPLNRSHCLDRAHYITPVLIFYYFWFSSSSLSSSQSIVIRHRLFNFLACSNVCVCMCVRIPFYCFVVPPKPLSFERNRFFRRLVSSSFGKNQIGSPSDCLWVSLVRSLVRHTLCVSHRIRIIVCVNCWFSTQKSIINLFEWTSWNIRNGIAIKASHVLNDLITDARDANGSGRDDD